MEKERIAAERPMIIRDDRGMRLENKQVKAVVVEEREIIEVLKSLEAMKRKMLSWVR